MKLALATQTSEVGSPAAVSLLSGTFEERAAKAAAWGAAGLELLPIDPAALDPQAVRKILQRNGLEAAAIGSVLLGFAGLTLLHSDPKIAAQAESRLHALIDFAAAVGAPLVGLGGHPGRRIRRLSPRPWGARTDQPLPDGFRHQHRRRIGTGPEGRPSCPGPAARHLPHEHGGEFVGRRLPARDVCRSVVAC